MEKKDTNDRNELRINEAISEISACREDERSTQDQLIQVIVAAGTVLGIIFAISNFNRGNHDNTLSQGILKGLLILNDLIFCTAFSYATSLGINNTLRYQYIRDLEDRLAILISEQKGESEMMHWMSLSASVNTRNSLC